MKLGKSKGIGLNEYVRTGAAVVSALVAATGFMFNMPKPPPELPLLHQPQLPCSVPMVAANNMSLVATEKPVFMILTWILTCNS